jgi:hypothetical protein
VTRRCQFHRGKPLCGSDWLSEATAFKPGWPAVAGLLFFALLTVSAPAQIGGTGWTPLPLNFKIQWPYTTNESSRYWFTNNIYHCLVYSNDAPFQAGSATLPRTEQRFNPDYTNGEIQYQASLMAASNENSYCVFQIHTGDAEEAAYGSTTFMLFWFTNSNGSVRDYSGTVLATNLDNQWFALNVDHNLVTHTILVWINQVLVWTQQDNSAGDFYFKDGVYEQSHGPTLQMDAYVTNILMWTSSGTNPPAAPTGLAATPALAQIGLAWNPSVGATNYNLKRSTVSGGPYATITNLTGTNDTDASVTNGTVLYYVVAAVDAFGESANSAQVDALPTVTHPLIRSLSLFGANALFQGTNQGTGIYYVLTTTNLAQPLSQWRAVATNVLSGSGNFTLAATNAVFTNAGRQFYILSTTNR